MVLAALPTEVQTLWWVTLGIGLVVPIVVVVLLQTLLKAVKRIDEDVAELWATATTVARNTATTWQLGDTGDALEDLKAEALLHDELLSRKAEG